VTDRDAAVLAALRAVPAGALPMHLAPGLGLGVKQVSTVLQRLRIAGLVRFEAPRWTAIEEPRP
jgi:hypothetical protein